MRAHLAAYNPIRHVMCEAAKSGGVHLGHIRFKGAITAVLELLPILGGLSHPDAFCRVLFGCCLVHGVGNRPDRYEPRVVKPGPKPDTLMNQPRNESQLNTA